MNGGGGYGGEKYATKKPDYEESEFDSLKKKFGYQKLKSWQSDDIGKNLMNWVAIITAYTILGFKGFGKAVATQIANHGGSGGGDGGDNGGNIFLKT